ncbi:hypothetical protein [Bradyrhizobium sp. USDA 4451]
MTSRTAWTGGNGAGLTWTTGINSSDLVSMANGKTVLSTVSDIANGTNLDQFMDVSVRCAIASSTIASGATLALWLYQLLDDGSTYGDGQLTAGTQATVTPTFAPCGVIPLIAAASQTLLVGAVQGILLPPGSFRLALQNNSGFALTSGTQTVKYRTYNQNLNA